MSFHSFKRYLLKHLPPWLDLPTLFFLGLTIRLVMILFVVNLPLAGDELYYWNVQKSLRAGNVTPLPVRPPLWAAALTLPGVIHDHPVAGRLFSTCLGALSPVMICLIGRHLVGRGVGLLAGAIYCVFPEHVAYSHYLWSENLFGLLCLISVLFFVRFLGATNRGTDFFWGSFIAGVALLTKEFAILVFAAEFILLAIIRFPKKSRTLALGSLIFVAPALLYSVTISQFTQNAVFLSDAPIGNFRQALGLGIPGEVAFSTAAAEQRRKSREEFTDTLTQRGLWNTAQNFKKQFYNLWTPNSFPVVRLKGKFVPWSWDYRAARPAPWIALVVGSYIVVMSFGICGLCLSSFDSFKGFSILALVLLSMTAILALLCSRFRLPFMFVPVIYSSVFLLNLKSAARELRDWKKLLPLLAMLGLFAHICIAKFPTLGDWG